MSLITTRFAPSPTGLLHLGHAVSARFARNQAKGGRFLLRIEDIDQGRCREEFVAAIIEDLAWLGLDWDGEIHRQSQHFADYAQALEILRGLDLLYPCFCTRADIRDMAGAPQGPDGPIYPGRCRTLSSSERDERRRAGQPFALRLKLDEAIRIAGPLDWEDLSAGVQRAQPALFGDVVLARKDIPASYHLAVTWDDAEQGVTLVTRGMDLFPASHLHRLLQALLKLPVPRWHHHPLVMDEAGKRLAKRDGAPSIRSLREKGMRPEEVWNLVAGVIGP
jgi:glutamyl-Q tRNA(Asp) synthetase